MFSLAQNYLTRGFWGDEAWTSLISQLPYLQMLKTTAADFHPPAYYTVIELWYKIFPTTEVSTRIVSIIFYLATVFMVYKLASSASVILNDSEGSQDSSSPTQNDRKGFLGLNNFGLISAVVVAVNPIFFRYAFEARNYMMFAFAATGSIYFLVRLSLHLRGEIASHLRGGKLLMTAFVIFSALGIYTHYYMFFVLAAEFLYVLLFDRKILFATIVAYFVVALLYLPWIPFLLGQLTSVASDYWIGGIDKQTHFEALLRILGGEQQNMIRPWLFGLSATLLIVGLLQHTLRHKFEKPYLLVWLWAIIPFILATLPGFRADGIHFPFRPIFFWRYLIPASIPLSMVMIHTAQKLPKYLMWGAVGLLIVLSMAVDGVTIASYPYGFKQVYASEVAGKIRPGDRLVTVLPSFAEVLYYRNRNNLSNDLIVLPEGLVQFSGKSLLDAYVKNRVATIGDRPTNRYFELTPGPKLVISD